MNTILKSKIPQAKDLIAELNKEQRKQAVNFFKRECQPDAELLDMLTYWLID